jgi:hypothetical protein
MAELQQEDEAPLLSSEHQRLLSGRLSSLLSATAGASLLDSKRAGLNVYEAECRHTWDALQYHFYVATEEEIISPT